MLLFKVVQLCLKMALVNVIKGIESTDYKKNKCYY